MCTFKVIAVGEGLFEVHAGEAGRVDKIHGKAETCHELSNECYIFTAEEIRAFFHRKANATQQAVSVEWPTDTIEEFVPEYEQAAPPPVMLQRAT